MEDFAVISKCILKIKGEEYHILHSGSYLIRGGRLDRLLRDRPYLETFFCFLKFVLQFDRVKCGNHVCMTSTTAKC